jgi:thioredoxin reductase
MSEKQIIGAGIAGLLAGCYTRMNGCNSKSVLRKATPQIFSWVETPVIKGMSLLAHMHTGNAGFPNCSRVFP